ncbi:aldehyde dehydrogenase [Panus rudis PR-1116 ss-1]|nr:aldehyde dehydrogenase [Panus rudis PR-1116 ss-1]
MSQSTTPLLISGQLRPASNGATYEVRNPGTGKLVHTAAAASKDDCTNAIEAAGKAFETWRLTRPSERAAIFRKAGELITSDEYKDKIVQTVVAETATEPSWAFWSNIFFCRKLFDEAADMPYELRGQILPADFGDRSFVAKRPMGVIFVIAPWNAPVSLSVMTTLPALAAGNAIVLKTSEVSPASQLIVRVGEILKKAGLPDGVFNVIHTAKEDSGDRVSQIIAHPLVRKIGFTGSDRIGRIIATEAAKHLKPCVLELGGKAPSIVLNDATLDVAARGIIAGAFLHSGQTCVATERVIVQRQVSSQLIQNIVDIAKRLKSGDVFKSNPDAQLGPQFCEASAENIIGMVKEAVDGGAKLLVGDLKREGAFVQPHVVLDAKPGTRLWDREIFGPVLTITVVDTIYEAIELANASTYTLTSSLWTSNMQTAFEISERVRADNVIVNGMTMATEAKYNQAGLGGSSGYGKFKVDEFVNEQLIMFHDPAKQKFPVVEQ